MKTWSKALVVVGCFALCLAAIPALAIQHEGHEGHEAHGEMAGQDDSMMAYMKAATPGPQHEMLAKTAGKWTMEVKMWMDPSAEPTVSQATATRTLIMDGRYVVEDVKGTVMGMPFAGHGMTGYDNVTGKYWSTWIDNMSTGVMTMTGTHDAASNTTTYWGEGSDAASGEMVKSKTVIEELADGNEKMTMYMMVGGEEVKSMEIVWTRAAM